MAIGSRDPRARWGVAITASLLPVVLLYVLLQSYALPRGAAAEVQSLIGTWKVFPLSQPDGAAVNADDSRAQEVQLPGNWSAAKGPRGGGFARRHFTLTEEAASEDGMFTVGALWSGEAEVYVNGVRLGMTHPRVVGLKTDLEDIEGYRVDARLLHAGDNLVALKAHWFVDGEEDGVNDSRLWFGPARVLEPYLTHAFKLKHVIHAAELGLFIMLLVLLFTFVVDEQDVARKRREIIAAGLITCTALYVAINSGTVISIPETSSLYLTVISVVIAVMSCLSLEYMEEHALGRVTRFRWGVRAVSALFSTVMVLTYLTGKGPLGVVIYDDYLAVSALIGLWSVGLALWALVRRRQPADVLVFFTFAIAFITAFTDAAVDASLILAPRLYSVTIANFAIMVGSLVVADFVRLAYDNKALSERLLVNNRELAVALKEAQDMATLKGQLLANMSHELRTPLNTIINVPEALLAELSPLSRAACSACGARFELDAGEALPSGAACPACQKVDTLALTSGPVPIPTEQVPDLPRLLFAVLRNGRQLLRLIDEVLSFSKLDSRKLSLRLEPVDGMGLARELIGRLEPLARTRNLTLSVEGEGPLRLQVDPAKLEQMLHNLLDNAIKFSPVGATVKLSVRREGNGILFAVEDRGMGISAKDQALIFESFRQVDSSHTRRYGGFGLGLAITKGLAELHQGKIAVASEEGKGSTFSVWLPLEPSAHVPLQSAGTLAAAVGGTA